MATPIAEELAKKQKEISVAEFFERNKQILGFDSLTRAVLTSVKEGVDNALDACEEADILPDIFVSIQKVEKTRDEYMIVIEDNGPGIVKDQIPPIFGKLLYGSRFYAIRQSRGQQGIGISAVVMYAQLTTGRPTKITSKISEDRPAYQADLIIDTKKNKPEILREDTLHWDKKSGTKIELIIHGRYVKEKRQSVFEYLRSTAIVNPHARIILIEPDNTKTVFERATEKMPKPTVEIKPHPEGTELGTILKMGRATESYKLLSFLVNEFSRVTTEKAREICARANVDEDMRPQDINREQANRLLNAFKLVKIMTPPTDCLSPIGETLVKKGLKKEMKADFIVTSTRPPSVYSGNPFQVEAGIVYGGELPKEENIQIMRFGNRVPLLYQQGGCVITHAIENIDWRRYGLEQRGGTGIPVGPAIVSVHVASTKIPFTSESKEAIADISEIQMEIQLAMRECARKMLSHLRKQQKLAKMKEKEEIIRKVLPLIAEKSADVLNKPVPPIAQVIAKIMNSIIIEDSIGYDEKSKTHKVKIEITNYTPHAKKIMLKAVVPSDAKIQNINPKPESTDHVITWDIKGIPSTEKRALEFEILGLDKDDYDENELYVDGIDPELLSGADAWDQEAFEEKSKMVEEPEETKENENKKPEKEEEE
ncbi:MAG: DNA topoisomerase VI subunit B [Euryarchaeota archaeon CG01_land_8_20_14_3_00_38_12]|nr:MAG: DNA topoisomerase VI subunit B [Euryarchaeota archaeon CG01_land_8_20_14_3_00_38_12]